MALLVSILLAGCGPSADARVTERIGQDVSRCRTDSISGASSSTAVDPHVDEAIVCLVDDGRWVVAYEDGPDRTGGVEFYDHEP